ncbi:MAG: hypothetical protein JO303_15985 [Caulobacteraceae bacterium]|nr:hypothetical protein [Caulobacteraceae bacterium]
MVSERPHRLSGSAALVLDRPRLSVGAMKPPKPTTTDSYIIAAFDQPRARYICREAKRRHLVVVLDPAKAHRFESLAEAELECARYQRQHTGNVLGTVGGDFRVWRCVTKTTLSAVEREEEEILPSAAPEPPKRNHVKPRRVKAAA